METASLKELEGKLHDLDRREEALREDGKRLQRRLRTLQTSGNMVSLLHSHLVHRTLPQSREALPNGCQTDEQLSYHHEEEAALAREVEQLRAQAEQLEGKVGLARKPRPGPDSSCRAAPEVLDKTSSSKSEAGRAARKLEQLQQLLPLLHAQLLLPQESPELPTPAEEEDRKKQEDIMEGTQEEEKEEKEVKEVKEEKEEREEEKEEEKEAVVEQLEEKSMAKLIDDGMADDKILQDVQDKTKGGGASPAVNSVEELLSKLGGLEKQEAMLIEESMRLNRRLRSLQASGNMVAVLHNQLVHKTLPGSREVPPNGQQHQPDSLRGHQTDEEEAALGREVEQLRIQAEQLESEVAIVLQQQLQLGPDSYQARVAADPHEWSSSRPEAHEEEVAPAALPSTTNVVQPDETGQGLADEAEALLMSEAPVVVASGEDIRANLLAARKVQQVEQLLLPLHEKGKELSMSAARPPPCRRRPLGRSDLVLRRRGKALELLKLRYQLRCAGC